MEDAIHGGGLAPQNTMRVYYTGSDKLLEGYALCFNFDAVDVTAENLALSATTAQVCSARRLQVEKPSFRNHGHFAGVVSARSNGVTGPGWIEINRPGSVCNIYCAASADHVATTSEIGTGQTLTFTTGYYSFKYTGLPGCGSAITLQTVDRSSTKGLVMAELMTGSQSGGVQLIQASTITSAHEPAMASAADAVMSIGGSVFMTLFGVTMLNASGIDAVLTISTGLGFGAICSGLPVGTRKVFQSAQACTLAAPFTVSVSLGQEQTGSLPLSPRADKTLTIGSTVIDCSTLLWNGLNWVRTTNSSSLNTFT